MTTRLINGLATEVAGDTGRLPVVVVHGSMDRAGGFRRLRRQLGGTPSVLYDRRGYAGSAGAGVAATIAEQVDDMEDVIAATCDGPVVLVGHSLGGVLALHLAIRRTDMVAGLVVWEAPMPWEPWYATSAGAGARAMIDAEPADAAEHFMQMMIGPQRWSRLPSATRAQRRAEGPALAADLAMVRTPEARYDPAAVGVPLLVGRGSESAERFRLASAALAEQVPGASLVEVAGADHGVHLSHPADLARLVLGHRDHLSGYR